MFALKGSRGRQITNGFSVVSFCQEKSPQFCLFVNPTFVQQLLNSFCSGLLKFVCLAIDPINLFSFLP